MVTPDDRPEAEEDHAGDGGLPIEPDELPAGQAPRHVRRPRLFRPFRAGLYLLYGLIVAWLFVSISSSWVRSIWGDADDPVRAHVTASSARHAPDVEGPEGATTARATER